MDIIDYRKEVYLLLKQKKRIIEDVRILKSRNPYYPVQKQSGKVGAITRRLKKLKTDYPHLYRELK